MQRLSSLGFGTRWGDFSPAWPWCPFGGAYLILAGVHHLLEYIVGKEAAETKCHLTSPLLVLPGILPVMPASIPRHSAKRSAVYSRRRSQIFRALIVEPIRWVVQLPCCRAFFTAGRSRSCSGSSSSRCCGQACLWCVTPVGYWENPIRRGGVDSSSPPNLLSEIRVRANRRGDGRRWNRAGLAALRPASDHRTILAHCRLFSTCRANCRTPDVQRQRMASFQKRRAASIADRKSGARIASGSSWPMCCDSP